MVCSRQNFKMNAVWQFVSMKIDIPLENNPMCFLLNQKVATFLRMYFRSGYSTPLSFAPLSQISHSFMNDLQIWNTYDHKIIKPFIALETVHFRIFSHRQTTDTRMSFKLITSTQATFYYIFHLCNTRGSIWQQNWKQSTRNSKTTSFSLVELIITDLVPNKRSVMQTTCQYATAY